MKSTNIKSSFVSGYVLICKFVWSRDFSLGQNDFTVEHFQLSFFFLHRRSSKAYVGPLVRCMIVPVGAGRWKSLRKLPSFKCVPKVLKFLFLSNFID